MSGLDLAQCHTIILNMFSTRGSLELARAVLQSDHPEDTPQQPEGSLPWCVCRKCRPMPTSVGNLCCRQTSCITSTELFESTVLDVNVLSIAIIDWSDTFVESVDYSTSSYRKAAYRQFILWREGHLGRGNRKVVPSCVVWSVRNRFPAPDGMYLGFKEY